MSRFRFGIRDLLWAMVVVGMGLGWWRDHQALKNVYNWWVDHVVREHSSNPNTFKRLIMHEWPPHSP